MDTIKNLAKNLNHNFMPIELKKHKKKHWTNKKKKQHARSLKKQTNKLHKHKEQTWSDWNTFKKQIIINTLHSRHQLHTTKQKITNMWCICFQAKQNKKKVSFKKMLVILV